MLSFRYKLIAYFIGMHVLKLQTPQHLRIYNNLIVAQLLQINKSFTYIYNVVIISKMFLNAMD